jgi:branched-chain amino acid transport system substrate-binding protein
MKRRECASWLAASAILGAAGASRGATAKGNIRVGQSQTLSGSLAAVTASVYEGQRALLDEVNERGGVHGRSIEIVGIDDQSDSLRGVDNLATLIDRERVPVVFGLANALSIDKVLPVLTERKTPLIGVYGGADQARPKSPPYLFTTSASFTDELRQMVRTLSTLRTNRIGLAWIDSDFGRWLMPVLEGIAKEHGVTIVGQHSLNINGADAAAAADAVLASKPQAIMLLAGGPAVFGFMKALAGKPRVPVYALSIAAAGSVLKLLGSAARGMAVTQVVPYPWRATGALTRQFAASMARLKLPVSYDRMWGFLNASILVEALRRAGPDPSPAMVVAAMEGMNDVDLGGYRLQYSRDNHHGSHFVEITMVDDRGEYVR